MFAGSYFPDTLRPQDSVSLGLPLALDTVIACERFALADTVWIGGGIAEFGPEALFDSLLVVVEGEVVAIHRAVAGSRHAARPMVRISGNWLTLALPRDAVVSIEVFNLDGRLLVRLAERALLARGTHRFALPRRLAGMSVLRARIGEQAFTVLIR